MTQTAFARPTDFAHLFALACRVSLSLKTKIDAVYGYLEQLGRRPAADAPWHKPQTVGNCTWKATTSFLKDNLDERSYRTFKTYYRSRILFEAIEQMNPEGPMPQLCRRRLLWTENGQQCLTAATVSCSCLSLPPENFLGPCPPGGT